MTTSIAAITFDCHDALRQARFWSQALDRRVDEGEPAPSEFFARLPSPGPDSGVPTLMFIKVPEGKSVKNRVHLDLVTDDREAEVERLKGVGATVIHEKDEWGLQWVTLADPEGNEFCLAQHD
jgi:predicted enzyme related to lactoylglutathione lyase